MTIHLVRHAKAGDRDAWEGPDDLRPLSKAGRKQAATLADRFEVRAITRIVSSPSVRCRQTVQPLAERTRLPVLLDERLAEGASVEDGLALVHELLDEEAVLCTHGDVLPAILLRLEQAGVSLHGDRVDKGSAWALEVVDGAVRAAHHEPPPHAPGK